VAGEKIEIYAFSIDRLQQPGLTPSPLTDCVIIASFFFCFVLSFCSFQIPPVHVPDPAAVQGAKGRRAAPRPDEVTGERQRIDRTQAGQHSLDIFVTIGGNETQQN
jgi:hypothetical protein